MADPETAHGLALEGLRLGYGAGATHLLCKTQSLPVTVMGLQFPNPVGMAAGMDKNGDYIDALGSLGFGFIEVGTVTPRPQPGNPKPRIFRLEKANAMINRLGFNNKGVDHLVRQVKKHQYSGILGINIGKNFDTPNDRAADDYLICLEKVYPYADYITVNISSPNTRGLRDLQDAKQLDSLLATLNSKRMALADEFHKRVPLVVKVAPDLEDKQIPDIAEVVVRNEFDGLIATNTTIARDAVKGMRHADEQGGLSGAPLKEKANHVLARFRAHLPARIALIGTGGITGGGDAAGKIQLGADLVQFYTGFVYKGPDLVGDCINAIATQRSA
jgi:dihydroorotate dehydrogenase